MDVYVPFQIGMRRKWEGYLSISEIVLEDHLALRVGSCDGMEDDRNNNGHAEILVEVETVFVDEPMQ